MNRAQALELLSTGSSHERFRAAYFLVKSAELVDLSALNSAKHSETDAYVLNLLDAAIKNVQHASRPELVQSAVPESELSGEELLAVAKAQAIEWVSGLLLHEIGAKLGLVSFAASQDIADYESSLTKLYMNNLQSIFDAIGQLRSAANPPKYEDFDLSVLVEDITSIELHDSEIEVSFFGIRPFMVTSSKQLIRLALGNGIRNAIEAVAALTESANESYSKTVVVTWGKTDSEYWISIIDSGVGILDAPPNLFDVGKTTKSGHPGFGLAIAKQAMETLDGVISLENSASYGAKYEMRWGRGT
ncbi:ATP-binding protein [Aeromonas hydrophila]|uniref:sensor histidine kinase n=1 Tax=Aeromonas hydrophila TaxID=644 RepID=UPI002255B459|nr:ATP-binding protein [Aeromonas hydrophila]MCX4104763.1 ATP-binding protein [Aeromonas hydrophila]